MYIKNTWHHQQRQNEDHYSNFGFIFSVNMYLYNTHLAKYNLSILEGLEDRLKTEPDGLKEQKMTQTEIFDAVNNWSVKP